MVQQVDRRYLQVQMSATPEKISELLHSIQSRVCDVNSWAIANMLRLKDNMKESEMLLFQAEELEAEEREAAEDVKQFKSACSEIQDAICDIDGMNQDRSHKQLECRKMDALLQFACLKKLNRLAHFRCRKARDETHEAKLKTEKCHQQLQNLLYEAMHLQKEIRKCVEFRSLHEEIDMVPVVEFYGKAPKDVSRSEVTLNDPHQQMLARLQWELDQRKALTEDSTEAQKLKDDISQYIQEKEDYLDALQPKLCAILEATKPVQSYLEMPYDEVREQQQTARHLPINLYVLYMQCSAYQHVCDKLMKMKVWVEGDVTSVKSVDTGTPDPDDDDSDSDADSDSGEQGDSKSHDRKSAEARLTERQQRLLHVHPLSVALEITATDGSILHLTFYFLTVLRIIGVVVVKVTPSADVLTGSLSAGIGDLQPYVGQVGRSYMWAQQLGGLQFSDPCQTSIGNALFDVTSVGFAHAQQTVMRLYDRLTARTALLRQLVSLEKGQLSLNPTVLKRFPATVTSRLVAWRGVVLGDVEMIMPHIKLSMADCLLGRSDLLFEATVEWNDSVRMTAIVAVPVDYPKQPPLFQLSVGGIGGQTACTALTDHNVKEMERQVNLHYEYLVYGGHSHQVLSAQVQCMLMCFDVYLKTGPSQPVGGMPIEKVIQQKFRSLRDTERLLCTECQSEEPCTVMAAKLAISVDCL